MKERPILFNGEMVRAILEGRKTQTRRVVKGQDVKGSLLSPGTHLTASGHKLISPYGVPGDRLWVRETWYNSRGDDSMPTYYRADQERHVPSDWQYHTGPWKPSIFMERWASRITLEITDVRVERVRDISQKDAMAEGGPPSHRSIDRVSRTFGYSDFSRSWFAQLWDSINEKRGFGWDANPWVWVVEFKRVKP